MKHTHYSLMRPPPPSLTAVVGQPNCSERRGACGFLGQGSLPTPGPCPGWGLGAWVLGSPPRLTDLFPIA